jgi:hypothetical protein
MGIAASSFEKRDESFIADLTQRAQRAFSDCPEGVFFSRRHKRFRRPVFFG